MITTGVVATGLLANGEALLYDQSKTIWFLAVPLLTFLLSPLLALGRFAGILVAMPLLAWLVAEVGFGFVDKGGPSTKQVLVAGERIRQKDAAAASGPLPNNSATIRRVVDGKTVFEVTYDFDAHARRVTPVAAGARPEYAALFLGGSWVLGTGVENDETFAAEFARLRPEYRSYNYGFHGIGPPQVLDLVRNRDLQAEVFESVDLVVQLLGTADLRRTIGTMRISADACRRCSNYDFDGTGALVRQGDFSVGRPFRTVLYSLLEHSNLLRFLGIDIPWTFSDEDRERTAAVVGVVRDELAEEFPAASFYVVLRPNDEAARAMTPFLEEQDLAVMDLVDAYDGGDLRMRISADDSHPSALAYRAIAERLVADLEARRAFE